MSTRLKGLYRSLTFFSVATQIEMCNDLTRQAKDLAKCFAEALKQNSTFDNRGEPFLSHEAIDARPQISPRDTNDNGVIALLEQHAEINVDRGPADYNFCYIQRQVPPLRRTGAGDRHSGKGGIDYIARSGNTPILGEVKRKSDKNAFYAFIQLLKYLSEMATSHQIERANGHHTFGADGEIGRRFDLHILLADRNPGSETEKLVEPTRLLATSFRRALREHHPIWEGALGRVLCLGMSSAEFGQADEGVLLCRWYDE
jgi:hypothetical protein